MNVFFDNCVSPVFATTLHGFIQHNGQSAFHIRDLVGLPNGRHSKDIEWITYLRNHSDNWIFITNDMRLMKNKAERAALRQANLHGFVLAPAFVKMELHRSIPIMISRWPDILKTTELLAAPSMHEIPINRSTKLRQLPL